MSETQLKVTGTFQATDEKGNLHTVTEYTLFRHTSDTDMKENIGGGDIKEYRLGNDAPVRKISENEFEIAADGTRIFKKS